MSLANIKGKMSRLEMRNIMAGSGSGACQDTVCKTNADCCTMDPICTQNANWNNKTCYH